MNMEVEVSMNRPIMKLISLLVVTVMLGALFGCSATRKSDDRDVVSGKGKRKGGPGSNSSLRPWEVEGNPLYNRVVYFDFDKSDVRHDARELVTRHSTFLASNPNIKVRLEGHADERGSREYNIGLGERRAQAVRRLMLFQGVTDRQLESISYGEERPAVEGHDEGSWAKNRRVELVYLN